MIGMMVNDRALANGKKISKKNRAMESATGLYAMLKKSAIFFVSFPKEVTRYESDDDDFDK